MEITFNTKSGIDSLRYTLLIMSLVLSILTVLMFNILFSSKNITMTTIEDIITFISIFMVLFIGCGSANGVILTYFMTNKRHVKETASILSYHSMKSNGSRAEALVLFQNRQKEIRVSVDKEGDIRVGNDFNIEYDVADTLFYCQILFNVKATPCV